MRQTTPLATTLVRRSGAFALALLIGASGCDALFPGLADPCPSIWATDIPTADTASFAIIAHRGFARCFPENTLEAIDGATAMGFTALEVDVRMTRDDVPVLMHDSTVDRTTTGLGYVAELSWAQLQVLDACPDEARTCRVPTLAEALDRAHDGVTFWLDLKGAFSTQELASLVETIAASSATDRTRLITGSYPLLLRISEEHPSLSTGFVYFPSTDQDRVMGSSPEVQGPRARVVVMFVDDIVAYPHHVADLRRAGITIVAATIETWQQWRRVDAVGVRHVFSDVPIGLDVPTVRRDE